MAPPIAAPSPRLIWMDLEMTGLNPETDHILEIATIITDNDLSLIQQGPCLVIHQDEGTLNRMDEWNQKQHRKSGLLPKVRASDIGTSQAEALTLAFIKKLIPPREGVLCGNSIWQDRRFIARHMPALDQYLHYRMLDVSSVKILSKLWFKELPHFEKKEAHRALDDIEESIRELIYYRQNIFRS
ncbi:MAG: oligoribonuclease [Deltaproteobacteria bacterium]|nr:oligoribonuclease [Deltaproteobacteria bacterium]